MVCGAQGACEPLDPGAARFSRSVWLSASDWGTTERGGAATSDSDLLLLGGPRSSEIYLAFGPLPEAPRVQSAVLVLVPHETWAPPTSNAEIEIFTTRRFRGRALTRRDAPRRVRTPVSRVGLGAGTTREIRLDLTEAVAKARARGVRVVSVAIAGSTAEDGAPLRIGSPRALSAGKRPRLELSVQ